MFEMKIENQMNIADRTLLSGVPKYDSIPEKVSVDGKDFKVIGTSYGVPFPFMSIEIEKTSANLIGKTIK